MFNRLLNDKCNIFRLSGFPDCDFSESKQGEVEDIWTLVATDVPCRMDRAFIPSRRLQSGPISSASLMLFIGPSCILHDDDRIILQSTGQYYLVSGVVDILGFRGLHHKEAHLTIIDWIS
jgi:hypothetical protein